MNSNIKHLMLWVILIAVAGLLIAVVRSGQGPKETDMIFSEFMNEVSAKHVSEATIAANDVHGKLTNGAGIHVIIPLNYPDIYNKLDAMGVKTTIKDTSSGTWLSLLLQASPFIVLAAFWIFMVRQMQSGGNKALSFGKSRARLHSTQQKKVTFKDVAGVEEAKEELQEIIEFLREPQKFQKLGGRIPKGVLLIGPPGTGKTLLARAIAGEASVPFFSISGSDFVEMFVGVGASRVRDLFEQGKKNAPCIIFIDEIDAVGRHRGAGLGGGHDEREQTLNQLLVEMDGFESNEGVILVAATNRPDVLDPALLRPGRFDRRVVVGRPDVQGREAILRVHTKKIPLGDNVNLSVLARGTPGLAGADLANLVNEAALNAARQNRKVVMMLDFELAKDKILMGAERKSMVMSDAEKKNTAYHEAGHALVAAVLPDADPLHKVTIIPRGMALGVTMQLSGRIDRLDARPRVDGADGTELVVVDYKTGRHLLSVDDARSSLALAIYALAAARSLHRDCRRVELHHLPSGQVLAWEHTAESLQRHLRRAEDIAAECAEADERMRAPLPREKYDEVFPPQPGPGCGWCDYRRSCPEGQAAAAAQPAVGASHAASLGADSRARPSSRTW